MAGAGNRGMAMQVRLDRIEDMRRLVAGGHVERVCKGTYQRIVR